MRRRRLSSGPDAELLAAALGYAARGWRVFPLRPGTKKPAVPNHPAHRCDHTDPRCQLTHATWEHRSTTDRDRISKAWTRHPYGIGIACGPSGLLVVDLDAATEEAPSGAEAWAELSHGRAVVSTYTVATPSGGHHLYFKRPDGESLTNTTGRLGSHIDTRANGGYVVAPPTSTTGTYRVSCGQHPALAPAWLVQQLQPPCAPTTPDLEPPSADVVAGRSERLDRYVNAAVEGETHRLQTTTAIGERNHALFKASLALGQLVGSGLLDQATAERVLWANTSHHLAAGAYTETEAAATIASGLNRGKNDPRRLPPDLVESATR